MPGGAAGARDIHNILPDLSGARVWIAYIAWLAFAPHFLSIDARLSICLARTPDTPPMMSRDEEDKHGDRGNELGSDDGMHANALNPAQKEFVAELKALMVRAPDFGCCVASS